MTPTTYWLADVHDVHTHEAFIIARPSGIPDSFVGWILFPFDFFSKSAFFSNLQVKLDVSGVFSVLLQHYQTRMCVLHTQLFSSMKKRQTTVTSDIQFLLVCLRYIAVASLCPPIYSDAQATCLCHAIAVLDPLPSHSGAQIT